MYVTSCILYSLIGVSLYVVYVCMHVFVHNGDYNVYNHVMYI
jgi:nitrogen fixation-related uncharacterized protein